MSKDARPDEPPADTRLAPDPFAAVLPAIAALGAVTSISRVNWAAQEKVPGRPGIKRRAGVALKDLEHCCMGLCEIFRRFQRNAKLFGGEGGTAASPLKFGVHGPRVTADAARGYQQLINDLATMLVLASHNAFDVMAAIEDGEINPPESILIGLGEEQERLNKLLQTRATLRVTVDTGADVAEKLAVLVRQLKHHLVP